MNGSEIRQARERARLTQGELGEKVGVSGRTVGNWERGASIPRNRAARLVEVLNLDEQAEPANPLQVVSDATLLAEIARRFEEGRTREKAGEEHEPSSPSMNQAGVSPAPEDDGLGSFGGRARGDLDHEDINDGAGDNVYSLVPPPPASDTAAYRAPNRGKKQKDKQDEDAEGTQDPGDDEE